MDRGIYECYGSINPQLSERTGFSDTDAEIIKSILPKLFENDASSARPDGSMQVMKVLWWRHNSKAGQHSSARVHDSLRNLLQTDGTFDEGALKGTLHAVHQRVGKPLQGPRPPLGSWVCRAAA